MSILKILLNSLDETKLAAELLKVSPLDFNEKI